LFLLQPSKMLKQVFSSKRPISTAKEYLYDKAVD